MAQRFSDQTQSPTAVPGSAFNLRNGYSEVNAITSTNWFSRKITNPEGVVVQNDTIVLGFIPKGARLKEGVLKTSALGASVTIAIGSVGARTGTAVTAAYLAATSVAAISSTPFFATVALGFGAVLTEDTWIVATVAGANPDVAGDISGYIDYTEN